MKDAFATCEPRPGWFRTILYIPTTRPSASTTYDVTPGPIQYANAFLRENSRALEASAMTRAIAYS